MLSLLFPSEDQDEPFLQAGGQASGGSFHDTPFVQEDDRRKARLLHRLQEAVKTMDKHFPSCFLGLLYLWKDERDQAVACWQTRVASLDLGFRTLRDIGTLTATGLNHALWMYLYLGFIEIFEPRKRERAVHDLYEGRKNAALTEIHLCWRDLAGHLIHGIARQRCCA